MAIQRFQKIIRIGGSEATQTRSQREFNRLLSRIDALENELLAVREVVDRMQQRVQSEYLPLLRTYQQQRVELVRLLDRAIQSGQFKKAETRKLTDLLVSFAGDLIESGFDELRPIYDRYATDPGSEPDDVDLSESTRHASDHESFNPPKRPESAKKRAREEKQELTIKNVTKAVRSIYTDLVKAFHPDRELDETEKQRKTEIMHRVTEAYEKGDLLALLRLQLEFDRIDQQHLESLADEKLMYYNKMLRQQVQDLEHELDGQQTQLAALSGKPKQPVVSITGLEIGLNQDINTLKKATKELKSDLKALTNPDVLRQWLTLY